MARTKKLELYAQEMIEMENGVKQVQRVISKKNITNERDGYFSISDVDAYLSLWLNDGWKLLNTHYLGENPEGYIIWYILVKQ